MTRREILTTAFLFVLYILLQILLVRNLVLFDYGFCFIYVAAVLLLPYEISLTQLLLIGFTTGIVVDTFYNTLGIHAAATVLMAYLRPLIIRIQMAPGVQESRISFSLQALGIGAFVRYVFVLVLIHHTALFLVEAGSLSLLLPTLARVGASAVFTTVSIVLINFFTRN
ncbi:MAG: hypothetical protein H7Z72_21495 [Bacteroidetes bacterium]|nr:hypothetical protein [Fibrella sp.]